jgi:hypothetical protein
VIHGNFEFPNHSATNPEKNLNRQVAPYFATSFAEASAVKKATNGREGAKEDSTRTQKWKIGST